MSAHRSKPPVEIGQNLSTQSVRTDVSYYSPVFALARRAFLFCTYIWLCSCVRPLPHLINS